MTPEAAWALLDLYYLEGRGDDARRVALRQYEVEPDRRDRARLLLELVRQDAEPTAPASVVSRFAPAVNRDPHAFRAAIALGLALVHSGRADEGIATLREVLGRRTDDPDAWDAMLPTAQRMAELLDGQVLDEERNALGRQRIAHIRDELRGWDRDHEGGEIVFGR